MGSRQKPRFRMVLPVSIWGTDSSGKAFHQLAYTLDISMGGARLADVVVALKRDDIIAVRYKQRKARFRVVWSANKQVGIQYLEGERFIWIDLPQEEFVDHEPVERSPALPTDAEPPPATIDSGQAAIEVQQEQAQQQEQAHTEPIAGAVVGPGEAVQQSPSDEVAAALQKCMAILRELDSLVSSAGVTSYVARAFHAAAGHLRNSAWAVQQWVELQPHSKDTAVIIESVNAEQVRFTTQLCCELVKEQQPVDAGVSQEAREALTAAVQALAGQLGVGVPEPPVEQAPVRDPAILDPVALLAGLNDEIRSSSLPLEETLNLIAERACSFAHADGAAIALASEGDMVCCASAGVAPLVGIRFSTAGGLAGEAISTRQLVICRDAEQDERVDAALCRSLDLRSSTVVPIVAGDSVTGVLQVFARRPNAFDEASASLLQHLAEFVASLQPSLQLEADPR